MKVQYALVRGGTQGTTTSAASWLSNRRPLALLPNPRQRDEMRRQLGPSTWGRRWGVLALFAAACSSDSKDDGPGAGSQPTAPGGSPAATEPGPGMPAATEPGPGTPAVAPSEGAPSVTPAANPTDSPTSTSSQPTLPSEPGGGGAANVPAPAPDGTGGSTSAGGTTSAGGAGGGMNPDPAAGGAGGMPSDDPGRAIVYVGGYDYGSDDYPFQAYELDTESGQLTAIGEPVAAGANPSYITVSGTTLYVANERDDQLGGLTALAIGADGSLTPLNHQAGSDGGFTHVAVDPSAGYAFGASYNGGSISVFPIEADGSLGAEIENVDFGEGAQSHCVGFAGNYVYVPNKGNDQVAQLSLGADGSLSALTPPQVDSMGGAGPRHIALDHNGTLAWVINELNSTMTSYLIQAGGLLVAGSTVSTLPDGAQVQNTGAHVEVSPDGAHVYGSNRGHDSIVVYAADRTTGELTLLEHEATRGSTPRDFDLDASGRFLIVANQDSENLAVFSVGEDGTLDPLGDAVAGPPSPAAVQIVYLP